MVLKEKLEIAAARASKEALECQERNIFQVQAHLNLTRGGRSILPGQKGVAPVLDGLAHAVRLHDASLWVQHAVRRPCRLADMPMDDDVDGVQRRLSHWFDRAPTRGFVYVAWRQRPERFLYVGRATGRDRLEPMHHKLVRACFEGATLLSLIYPADGKVDRLEASIIELAWHATGQPPELNDRKERVGYARGMERLEQLGAFLRRVAKDMERVADDIATAMKHPGGHGTR